jgi:hypothetical protein
VVTIFQALAAPFHPKGFRAALHPTWLLILLAISGGVGALAFHAATRMISALTEQGFAAALEWWRVFFGIEPDRFAIIEGLLTARFHEAGVPALERTVALAAFLGAFTVVQLLSLPLAERLTIAVARTTSHGQAHPPDTRAGRIVLANLALLAFAGALAAVMAELRFRGVVGERLDRILYYPLVVVISGLLSVAPPLIRWGLSAGQVGQRLVRQPGPVLALGVVVGGLFMLPLEALRHGVPLAWVQALGILDFAALPLAVIGGAVVAMGLLEDRPALPPPALALRATGGLACAAGLAVLLAWGWYGHSARAIVDGKQGLYHCDYALEKLDLPNPAMAAMGGVAALANELLERHEGKPRPQPPARVGIGALLRVTNRFGRPVTMEPFELRIILDAQHVAELRSSSTETIGPGASGTFALSGELALSRPLETLATLVRRGPSQLGVELTLPLAPILGYQPRLELPVWRWRRS